MKTSELTGAALDWAVAKATKRLDTVIRDPARLGTSITDVGTDDDGALWVYVPGNKRAPYTKWSPSTDWAQSGPIIEREKITVGAPGDMGGSWVAWPGLNEHLLVTGPTPLIAAMRSFVASKLGDEVDVPKELL
jgi:hypothetical protein